MGFWKSLGVAVGSQEGPDRSGKMAMPPTHRSPPAHFPREPGDEAISWATPLAVTRPRAAVPVCVCQLLCSCLLEKRCRQGSEIGVLLAQHP